MDVIEKIDYVASDAEISPEILLEDAVNRVQKIPTYLEEITAQNHFAKDRQLPVGMYSMTEVLGNSYLSEAEEPLNQMIDSFQEKGIVLSEREKTALESGSITLKSGIEVTDSERDALERHNAIQKFDETTRRISFEGKQERRLFYKDAEPIKDQSSEFYDALLKNAENGRSLAVKIHEVAILTQKALNGGIEIPQEQQNWKNLLNNVFANNQQLVAIEKEFNNRGVVIYQPDVEAWRQSNDDKYIESSEIVKYAFNPRSFDPTEPISKLNHEINADLYASRVQELGSEWVNQLLLWYPQLEIHFSVENKTRDLITPEQKGRISRAMSFFEDERVDPLLKEVKNEEKVEAWSKENAQESLHSNTLLVDMYAFAMEKLDRVKYTIIKHELSKLMATLLEDSRVWGGVVDKKNIVASIRNEKDPSDPELPAFLFEFQTFVRFASFPGNKEERQDASLN